MDDLLKSSSLQACLESCVVLSCLHEDTPKQNIKVTEDSVLFLLKMEMSVHTLILY